MLLDTPNNATSDFIADRFEPNIGSKNKPIHHGELLSSFLEQNKITKKEFIALTELSKQGAYNLLDKKIFKKAEICLIHILFDIPLSEFGLPNDYFKTRFSKKKSNIGGTDRLDFFSFYNYSEGNDSKDSFIRSYFKGISDEFALAYKSIYSIEYLHRFKGLNDDFSNKKNLTQLETEFYAGLYSILRSKIKSNVKFKYYKIFQIPIGEFSHSNEIPKEEVLKKMIEYLSVQSFRFLLDCSNEDFSCNAHFFVLPVPMRLFTYHIVDSKSIICEYDRYHNNFTATQDIRFIDRVDPTRDPSDPVSKLIETYKNDFNMLTNQDMFGNAISLDRQLLLRSCKTLINDLENRIIHNNREIHLLEKNIKFKAEHDNISTQSDIQPNISTEIDGLLLLRRKLNKKLDYLNGKKEDVNGKLQILLNNK